MKLISITAKSNWAYQEGREDIGLDITCTDEYADENGNYKIFCGKEQTVIDKCLFLDLWNKLSSLNFNTIIRENAENQDTQGICYNVMIGEGVTTLEVSIWKSFENVLSKENHFETIALLEVVNRIIKQLIDNGINPCMKE